MTEISEIPEKTKNTKKMNLKFGRRYRSCFNLSLSFFIIFLLIPKIQFWFFISGIRQIQSQSNIPNDSLVISFCKVDCRSVGKTQGEAQGIRRAPAHGFIIQIQCLNKNRFSA